MDNSYIARTSGIKAKDKLGYAMGDVASCMLFGLVQSVLQRFYTDILQIGIVSIMFMMIVARVWDAINDPIWGRIIDNARPAADGRYRRWIKIFALPSVLFRLLGGSTVVSSLVNLVEISGFEPEQTEPKSVVLPLHHISGCQECKGINYF